jgi:4-hydroxy-tetrahydrodipicolinate reductase
MLAHNTSLGAMYLTNVTEKGAKFFNKKDYEIDISETHSAQKKDIPSGTAIALLNAVLSSCPTLKPVYSCNGPREKGEISVTSKRIGDIVAEHEVSFVDAEKY